MSLSSRYFLTPLSESFRVVPDARATIPANPSYRFPIPRISESNIVWRTSRDRNAFSMSGKQRVSSSLPLFV